ncbi:hypothetical protein ACQV2E_11470 [Pantoea allii]|uniref:hypothetical protein n=1 Tax=Pantoea allii TaxID=574096 RepID=UPI003D30FE8C
MPAFILNAARALDDRFLPERDIHPGKPVLRCEKTETEASGFICRCGLLFQVEAGINAHQPRPIPAEGDIERYYNAGNRMATINTLLDGFHFTFSGTALTAHGDVFLSHVKSR